MKPLLIAVSAAAVAFPVAVATPAAAQSWEYRQERRECNRELRRADSRREYRRELRECRRELRRARYGSRYHYPYRSRHYYPYRSYRSRYYYPTYYYPSYHYPSYHYPSYYYPRSYYYPYGYGYGYYPRHRSRIFFGVTF